MLGAGFIGIEAAEALARQGLDVTVVELAEHVLPPLEAELAALVTGELHELGIGTRTGIAATGIQQGAEHDLVALGDGTLLPADLIVLSVGVRPDTAVFEAAGVKCEHGAIVVDEHGRTSAEGVWALGDVSSPYMLKHVANHEARVVAHNLAHPDEMQVFNHRAVPSAVFTHPQVASVGMTADEARDAGHDVVVTVQEYGSTAYGWAMEDTESRCVLVGDRSTGDLLGAHIVGPQAATLIQPLVQAMSLDTSLDELARAQYWIHPALTEVVENAVLGLLGHMSAPPEITESTQTPG